METCTSCSTGRADDLQCSNQLSLVEMLPQPDPARSLVRWPAAIVALPLVNILQEDQAHRISRCWRRSAQPVNNVDFDSRCPHVACRSTIRPAVLMARLPPVGRS